MTIPCLIEPTPGQDAPLFACLSLVSRGTLPGRLALLSLSDARGLDLSYLERERGLLEVHSGGSVVPRRVWNGRLWCLARVVILSGLPVPFQVSIMSSLFSVWYGDFSATWCPVEALLGRRYPSLRSPPATALCLAGEEKPPRYAACPAFLGLARSR